MWPPSQPLHSFAHHASSRGQYKNLTNVTWLSHVVYPIVQCLFHGDASDGHNVTQKSFMPTPISPSHASIPSLLLFHLPALFLPSPWSDSQSIGFCPGTSTPSLRPRPIPLKVDGQVQCSQSHTSGRFSLSTSFRVTPECGYNVTIKHFQLTPAHRADPSIN